MKIVSLLENVCTVPGLTAKHGLSLYIEIGEHRILFDLGPDDSFLKNAKKLGIDIAAVDTVIISHGHYDHGGGLAAFLRENSKAKVYIRKEALEPHYARILFFRKYIGIDPTPADSSRFVFTGESCVIDDGIELFSGVTERRLYSSANASLCKKAGRGLAADDFVHEQYLVLSAEGKQILITGCSHNGIVNIINKFKALYKTGTDCTVVVGFHLYNPTKRKYEPCETVDAIAGELNATGWQFYTCHCTGTSAYQLMKATMGDGLGYLSTGEMLTI